MERPPCLASSLRPARRPAKPHSRVRGRPATLSCSVERARMDRRGYISGPALGVGVSEARQGDRTNARVYGHRLWAGGVSDPQPATLATARCRGLLGAPWAPLLSSPQLQQFQTLRGSNCPADSNPGAVLLL